MGFRRGRLHAQQVHDLAQRGNHRDGALGARQILHGAAQKDGFVLEIEAHFLAGQSPRHFPPDSLNAGCGLVNGQVVNGARAILLPKDDGRLSRRFAIDQHLARIHRQRLSQIPVGHRDASQVNRSIQDQRLAHGDHQIRRARIACANRRQRHPYQGRRQPKTGPRHCLSSPRGANCVSARLTPLITSTTRGLGGGNATGGGAERVDTASVGPVRRGFGCGRQRRFRME